MTSPNRVNATNPDDAKERRGSAVRDAAAKMGKASLHSGVIMSMLTLFCVSVCVISIGLVAFYSQQNSSDLCTTTSRASVNDLAVGIQNQVGALLRSEMYNLITPATDIVRSCARTYSTGIISYYNYEELLRFMFNEIRLNTAVQELFYIDDATGNFLSAWRPRNMPPGTIATTFFNTNPALYSCPLCFSSPQLNGSTVRHQFTINPNFTIGSLIARFTFTPDFRDRPWFFQARTMELGSAVWANAWMDPVNFAQRGAALTAGSPVVINGTFRGGFGANMRTQELNENLKSFNLTKNGFVYVMGTNGIMIGSSINETLVITFPNDTVLMRKANELADIRITTTYSILLSQAPSQDLTRLPTSASYDINNFLFQHRLFQDPYNLTLVVVFGAPKKDYIGNVDELEEQLISGLKVSNVKIIVISVVVFVACTGISIGLTLLVLSKPLSILCKAMQDATRFDFTLLREGKLDHRSLIFELASMETAFVTMLKKFAEAIQANKGLQGTTRNAISSHQSKESKP